SSGDKVSLGQSKRVAIARAVAAGAKVLFLDEPLAGLDKDGICDVLEFLAFVVKQHQATLIVVEHIFNHPHLDGLLTTDWLLTDGRIQSVQADGQENGVVRRSPMNGDAKEIPWVSLFAEADAEVINESLPRGAVLTRIRRPGVFVEPPQAVLEVRDLVVKRGKRVVLGTDEDGVETGLNLTVYKGEIVILQAPNGWGKTTLFNAITGLFAAQRGTISLLNQPLSNLKTWERIRQGLTVLPSENVGFSSLGAQDSLKLAGSKGLQLDVSSLGNRAVSSLSGGERRRLALAGLQEGHIAVCDEPFGALDGKWAQDIAQWLSQRIESIFIVEPYRNI
ncbi:MAG: ATP-binding cassette domain-containing protein, partial [Candidatus Electrothrix sp. MAN1_4]|nr:ATP-binding cassette domain-containing protein [Candidatus Electrothrix sp. MAN1_4]